MAKHSYWALRRAETTVWNTAPTCTWPRSELLWAHRTLGQIMWRSCSEGWWCGQWLQVLASFWVAWVLRIGSKNCTHFNLESGEHSHTAVGSWLCLNMIDTSTWSSWVGLTQSVTLLREIWKVGCWLVRFRLLWVLWSRCSRTWGHKWPFLWYPLQWL